MAHPLLGPTGAIRLAFCFLTRLPVSAPLGTDGSCPPLAAAAWAFPLVGIAVGGIAGLVLMGASAIGLHATASVLVALAAAILLTGGLHEDGLADVADGFGGGRSMEDKLAIMRDSRIGSYGVLALILAIGLRVSLLSAVAGPGAAALALIAAGAVSRAAMVPVMALLGPARQDGLGAAAGRPKPLAAWIALALAGSLAVALLWPREDLFLAPWAGIAAVGAAMAAALVVAALAQRHIGGQTGDVLGCVQQAAEVAALAAIAAAA